jgi:prepilin-type processing-associated H-X9-DG protein
LPQGRSNYYANMGTNAWVYNSHGTLQKNPATIGVFAYQDTTRIDQITDGTSNTTLFAEVKRGSNPTKGPLDVTLVNTLSQPTVWHITSLLGAGWDSINNGPVSACNNPSPPNLTYSYTGLEYECGFFITALYTHTVPPNYPGRDCLIFPTLDQGHLAARSYHPGGVNIVCADGSVHFISTNIAPSTWSALGTRAGEDIVEWP